MKLVRDTQTGNVMVALTIHDALALNDTIKTILMAEGDPIDERPLVKYHDHISTTLHESPIDVEEVD